MRVAEGVPQLQRVGINQCNEFVEFAVESPKAVSDERHETGHLSGRPGLSLLGYVALRVNFTNSV